MTHLSLAIYPSHDANVCVQLSETHFRIFEAERYFKERYCSLLKSSLSEIEEFYQKIFDICLEDWKKLNEKLPIEQWVSYENFKFKTCYHLHLPEEHQEILKEIFGVEEFIQVGHHLSHAACSFYQSLFKESLVISYDGGGFDGGEGDDRVTFFNIYYANRHTGEITRICKFPYDLGTAYGLCALPISEIKKGDNWKDYFLSFAGKLMGLVAYGNGRTEWVSAFEKYFRRHKWVEITDLDELGRDLNLGLTLNNLSGQLAYDFAATAQFAFENVILECIAPILQEVKYLNLPICFSGGCALNVLMNQYFKDNFIYRNIFIPPNPNDCGLSFGMVALHGKPQEQIDLRYNGWPILDYDGDLSVQALDLFINKHVLSSRHEPEILLKYLRDLLVNKKTVGIVRGNSEVGPRALGNRSIVCLPTFHDMKDVLNSKIKFREFFRPFAPIVQADKVSKYFEFEGDASYMSFSPRVREKYKNDLPAITHQDSTSRIQTVTRQQNQFLYDLLDEVYKVTDFPILLNTSFNIKGKPMLTTVDDAIKSWQETELDCLLIEDFLFEK